MLRAFADGAFFGEVLGAEPVRVLALHGWRRTHEDFHAALRGLPVLALDLPGFGSSPPPPQAWSTADYARAVAPILDELQSPAVLVGHSFGGRVAVYLAAAHGARLGGLVLSGVPGLVGRTEHAGRSPWRYRFGRALHRRGLLGDERLEQLRRRYGSEDYRAATGVMRDVLVRAVNETYEEQLGAVRCHVDLLWGQNDTAAPLEVAEAAAVLLADARLTALPGVGHLVPTEAPDALRETVERALAVAR